MRNLLLRKVTHTQKGKEIWRAVDFSMMQSWFCLIGVALLLKVWILVASEVIYHEIKNKKNN